MTGAHAEVSTVEEEVIADAPLVPSILNMFSSMITAPSVQSVPPVREFGEVTC